MKSNQSNYVFIELQGLAPPVPRIVLPAGKRACFLTPSDFDPIKEQNLSFDEQQVLVQLALTKDQIIPSLPDAPGYRRTGCKPQFLGLLRLLVSTEGKQTTPASFKRQSKIPSPSMKLPNRKGEGTIKEDMLSILDTTEAALTMINATNTPRRTSLPSSPTRLANSFMEQGTHAFERHLTNQRGFMGLGFRMHWTQPKIQTVSSYGLVVAEKCPEFLDFSNDLSSMEPASKNLKEFLRVTEAEVRLLASLYHAVVCFKSHSLSWELLSVFLTMYDVVGL
ncbi:hypothetical protein Ancab_035065 [Ancistrocladus abbreviatus]